MLQLPFSILHPLIDHFDGFSPPAGEALAEDLERGHVDEDEVALEAWGVHFLAPLEVDLEDGDLCLVCI